MSGGFREIQLTRGFVTIVDEADFEWLSQWRWSAHRERNYIYAVRSVRPPGRPRTLRIHREIAQPSAAEHVDHINGDTLDNRRSNLRCCSHGENMANRVGNRVRRTGVTYKGVRRQNRANAYRASIQKGGRTIALGSHPTAEAAARAYDEAAKKHHGAFARLNFPDAGHAGSAVACVDHPDPLYKPATKRRHMVVEAAEAGLSIRTISHLTGTTEDAVRAVLETHRAPPWP